MTTKSFLTASAFFMAVALGCNTDTPITPAMKLTPVLVESGNISGTTFTSSGAFKASDNAIGYADSTQTKANGYWGQDNYVYVFEGNTVPSVIDKLPASEKYYCLTSATWVASATYAIEKDMEVEVKSNYFYVRDHYVTPEIKREEATVLGKKVYRYKDQWWIEDYRKLSFNYKILKNEKQTTNYADSLSISPNKFLITTSRSGIIIDPKTGVFSSYKSTATEFDSNSQSNEFDKLYFLPTDGSNPRYRVQILILKLSDQEKKDYFVRATANANWEAYYNENYLTKFSLRAVRQQLNKIRVSAIPAPPPTGEHN